ncbi:MAG TPA: hypothetical protein VNJ46_07060, partial [Gaiellaceae bacterium]|nr:hypothetical protein [Gaiellaceae bacterium]
GAAVTLFRLFVADRIVHPENGPASRELARAVARELLPREPYRSYGITLDEFFSSGSFRMHEDLTVLADRTWGWDDDYAHLARVAREAILAHPGAYARGVARDLWRLLLWPLYPRNAGGRNAGGQVRSVAHPRPARNKRDLTPGVARASAQQTGPDPGCCARRPPLPAPSEGEPIPAARESAFISTPDGRIREVWTSPTAHRLVFPTRRDEERAAELDRRVGELLASLPDREPRPELVRLLETASRWYPRPVVWLLIGLAALAWRRPRRPALPLALAAAALLVLVATALAVYAVAEYSVPVVPAFVLLATAGLLGPKGRLRSRVAGA